MAGALALTDEAGYGSEDIGGLRISNGGDFTRTLKHQIYVSVHSFKQSAATLTPMDRLALPEKRQTCF